MSAPRQVVWLGWLLLAVAGCETAGSSDEDLGRTSSAETIDLADAAPPQDFLSADGEPGHFRMSLAVYDRAGKACPRCRTPIRAARVGQRSAFWCPRCQA